MKGDRSKGLTAEMRFMKRVRLDVVTGCWIWIGRTSPEGLPQYASRSARRVAYERLTGTTLKPSQFAVSDCDDQRCVCPHHAVVCSKRVYIARAKARGGGPNKGFQRARIIAASRRRSELSMEAARAIRLRAASGELLVRLADEYGTTPANMGHIVANRTWRDSSSPLALLAQQAGFLI